MYNVRIFLRSWDLSISTCYTVAGIRRWSLLYLWWCKTGRQMPSQIKGQVGRVDNSTGARSKNRCKYQLPLQMHVLAHKQFGYCQKNPSTESIASEVLKMHTSEQRSAQRTRSDICFLWCGTQRRTALSGQGSLSISVSLPM